MYVSISISNHVINAVTVSDLLPKFNRYYCIVLVTWCEPFHPLEPSHIKQASVQSELDRERGRITHFQASNIYNKEMAVDALSLEHPLSEDTLQLLFSASNSSNLENSLEVLISISRSDYGRSDLASRKVLPAVLSIVQLLTQTHHHVLSLCFKLLRNLCAGEVANQNLFLELGGVAVVSGILRSQAGSPCPDHGLVRWGLQVLANVSLAGKQHQRAIWEELYPVGFGSLARLGTKQTCDPLCMLIYTCCDGNPEWFRELSNANGWHIMAQILRTASSGQLVFFMYLLVFFAVLSMLLALILFISLLFLFYWFILFYLLFLAFLKFRFLQKAVTNLMG